MPDYNRIRYYCDKSCEITEVFVDQFLIHLCAEEEGFEKKFADKLASYRKVIQKMPEDWPMWLISQYIAFQLFREDGLASKYLDYLQVRRRSTKELDYLRFQIAHPWRFVFARIIDSPKSQFFDMKDVLTGEEFLLYSPGIADQERQHGQMSMYFLLICFNGECWQTYGTLSYFKGIQPFDLLYFAQQFKPKLKYFDDIPKLIAKDPVPFMILWTGGELSLTYHKEDLVVILHSEYSRKKFDPEKYKSNFTVIQNGPVYMLSLQKWHDFPHYSNAFYHQEKQILTLNAMTDRGYAKLIETLNHFGEKLPQEAEIRVTMAMFHATNEILGRIVDLNPYEKLFAKETAPKDGVEMEKLNHFMQLMTEATNSGRNYDLRELAVTAGIEYETAKQIEDQVGKKIQQMLGRNKR